MTINVNGKTLIQTWNLSIWMKQFQAYVFKLCWIEYDILQTILPGTYLLFLKSMYLQSASTLALVVFLSFVFRILRLTSEGLTLPFALLRAKEYLISGSLCIYKPIMNFLHASLIWMFWFLILILSLKEVSWWILKVYPLPNCFDNSPLSWSPISFSNSL